jgi:hypothetical protein
MQPKQAPKQPTMKKHVLFSAAMVAAMTASAQTGEITSNRGENWLSQDGDWGLTFEATPLINYAGNLFNGTTNNGNVGLNNFFSSTSTSGSGVVIGGKKLIDANTAYRGRVRIGFGSDKTIDLIPQTPAPSGANDPTATVENSTKNGFFALDLGVGLEKRVGSSRVVGIYGGDFNIGLGTSKTTNEFGNALTVDNQEGGARRTTESKNGTMFAFGLNGFVGIEWFCAPKISLSGEYSWGLRLSTTGTPEVTEERWDAATNAVVSTTTVGNEAPENVDKSSSFSLDTGVSRGMIGINFYFQ